MGCLSISVKIEASSIMYWKGTTAKNYFNPFAVLMGFILTRCSHFLQVLQHLLTFLHNHFFGYMELHSLPNPPPFFFYLQGSFWYMKNVTCLIQRRIRIFCDLLPSQGLTTLKGCCLFLMIFSRRTLSR